MKGGERRVLSLEGLEAVAHCPRRGLVHFVAMRGSWVKELEVCRDWFEVLVFLGGRLDERMAEV